MDKEICCQCSPDDNKHRLTSDQLEKIQEIVQFYKNTRGALIPVMHEIQKYFGYLPEEALKITSVVLDIPLSEIYGVGTFYSQFALEPKGEHIIRVCLGTACYVKGAQEIIDKLKGLLDVEVGKTTRDGLFTLEAARCLGACGLAPVMMVDDKVYGKLIPDDVIRIIEEYK